jgi:mannonate dehydratase
VLQAWRWFGPDDAVSLKDARQAGATGIVTALHHANTGEARRVEEVLKCRQRIEAAGLKWSVVESIGVGEEIKTRTGNFRQKIENYKASIRAVAQAGIEVACYNFMAVTDWSRINRMFKLPSGNYALRYDSVDFAAYDLFVLKREGAEANYPVETIQRAEIRFKSMSEAEIGALEKVLIEWLPARNFGYDRDGFKRILALYKDVSTEDMRANLIEFLREITPVAEEEGVRLCIHPDDPAFPIFGLPRVMSEAEDVRALFAAVPETACGLTLCTGSFGSNAENDLPAMAREFAPRIHFVHLRNMRHKADGSFYEEEHLNGDTDLIAVVAALMSEESRRAASGRSDAQIHMRPDHGHLLACNMGKKMNPGYSYVGRLKGLAELRGVMKTVEAFRSGRIE